MISLTRYGEIRRCLGIPKKKPRSWWDGSDGKGTYWLAWERKTEFNPQKCIWWKRRINSPGYPLIFVCMGGRHAHTHTETHKHTHTDTQVHTHRHTDRKTHTHSLLSADATKVLQSVWILRNTFLSSSFHTCHIHYARMHSIRSPILIINYDTNITGCIVF